MHACYDVAWWHFYMDTYLQFDAKGWYFERKDDVKLC